MKRQLRLSWRRFNRGFREACSNVTAYARTHSNFGRSQSYRSYRSYNSTRASPPLPDQDIEDAVFEPIRSEDSNSEDSSSQNTPVIPCEFCQIRFPMNQIRQHQRSCDQRFSSNRNHLTVSNTRRARSDSDYVEPSAPSAPPPPVPPRRARSPSPTDDFDNIPYNLKCPITFDLFRDPVVAGDGLTYEREAILRCIRENRKSPITRVPLKLEVLPNLIIKQMVEEFREECKRKRSQFRYKLDTHVKKGAVMNPMQNKHKTEYFIEWLQDIDSLTEENTMLVQFTGPNAVKLGDIRISLPVHPHLNRTYGRVQHQDEGVLLVQEYAPAQTLAQLMTIAKEGLPDSIWNIIIQQIVTAMDLLASNGVVHGCLTAENVLLYNLDEDIDKIQVKLTEIGEYLLSTSADKNEKSTEIAPEILSNENYSEKSDIFAVGALMQKIYSSNVKKQTFCEQCLATDPNVRPTIKELLEVISEWVKNDATDIET